MKPKTEGESGLRCGARMVEPPPGVKDVVGSSAMVAEANDPEGCDQRSVAQSKQIPSQISAQATSKMINSLPRITLPGELAIELEGLVAHWCREHGFAWDDLWIRGLLLQDGIDATECIVGCDYE